MTGKNQVFRSAGATCCTDSRQIWHVLRAPGSTSLYKILPESAQRVGMRLPKYQKVSFLGKSSPAGANP